MSRKWRAGALVGLALLITSIAAIAYLRSSPPAHRTDSTAIFCCGQSLVTSDFVDYSFVSATTGWAFVEPVSPPHNVFDEFFIFRTVDGGEHWRQLLAARNGSAGPTVHSLQFFDPNHGFAFVRGLPDRLYRTSDGGAHWSTPAFPEPNVVHVNFADARNGWFIAGPPKRLYRTNDGGNTWERMPDPPIDADNITFRNPSEGWLGSGGVGIPHVYDSTDSGRSWHRLDLPPEGQPWPGGLATSVELLPRVGVVAYVPPFDQPELIAFSFLFTSFDAGTTWRIVPRLPGEISFQDAIHWWSIQGSALFKSADAGQSWTPVTDSLPNLQYIPHVLDAKHAWAVTIIAGGYGLATTSDGGLHWAATTVPHIA